MDILRITTAGSVDDGKSTLIGRLLFDTRSVTNDKLEAIEATSKRKGLDFLDLSLLTDGLIAEREQGITIDVAHIYFSTANRKYIIADSPGHVEYTRNMITGASTAAVSLILIDARKGVVEQTRRHFYLASLLRIQQVIICINKMDLASYSQDVFEKIRADFVSMNEKIGSAGATITYIPVAAKDGDNVVFSSLNMDWYHGPTLLECLENTPATRKIAHAPFRFSVQYVIRPHSEEYHDFRGYAGKLTSGCVKTGDRVSILPSLKSSKIKSIIHDDSEKKEAGERESVVITLDDDIDVSRGDMIIKEGDSFSLLNRFDSVICWMGEAPLQVGRLYLLQHGTNRVKAKITAVLSILDINSLDDSTAKTTFGLNDIGKVSIQLAKPIFADQYEVNAPNGGFIIIDESTNGTVGVGFV